MQYERRWQTYAQRLTFAISAVLVFVCFVYVGAVAANNDIRVVVDGVPVVFADQQPIIVDGRTLVPVRGVFEMMGFEVEWESGAINRVILTNENYHVVIAIGHPNFWTNNAIHRLDVPAQIIGERTMIPLRLPLESIGYYLEWNEATQTIYISSTRPASACFTASAYFSPIFAPNMPSVFTPGMIPVGRPSIQPGQGMPSAAQIQEWYDAFVPTELELAIWHEINRARALHGLDVLPWDHARAAAAALRITYKAESNIFDHHGGSFTTPDFFHTALPSRYGWSPVTASSRNLPANLNVSVFSVARIFPEGTLQSAGHRHRLLSPYNYSLGVATAISPHNNGHILSYSFYDAAGRGYSCEGPGYCEACDAFLR